MSLAADVGAGVALGMEVDRHGELLNVPISRYRAGSRGMGDSLGVLTGDVDRVAPQQVSIGIRLRAT